MVFLFSSTSLATEKNKNQQTEFHSSFYLYIILSVATRVYPEELCSMHVLYGLIKISCLFNLMHVLYGLIKNSCLFNLMHVLYGLLKNSRLFNLMRILYGLIKGGILFNCMHVSVSYTHLTLPTSVYV